MIKTRIGFIGTGIMGAPMSGHLANAGYPLTILDIERTRAEAVIIMRLVIFCKRGTEND